MLYFSYKNFDQLYHDFSRLPIYREKDYNFIKYTNVTWWLEDVVIESFSEEFHLDMSKLNYTDLKWKTLVNKYIDKKEYEEFKKVLSNSTKKSIIFNFKIHSYEKPSCLISMVITRQNNKDKWKQIKISYRCTEIFKKFAIDLILFNKIIQEINEECNCEIDKITLFIPLLFFRGDFLSELIGSEYYLYEEISNANTEYSLMAMKHYNKYYLPDSETSNYHTVARKQKLKARSENLPSLPIEKLNIKNTLKGD